MVLAAAAGGAAGAGNRGKPVLLCQGIENLDPDLNARRAHEVHLVRHQVVADLVGVLPRPVDHQLELVTAGDGLADLFSGHFPSGRNPAVCAYLKGRVQERSKAFCCPGVNCPKDLACVVIHVDLGCLLVCFAPEDNLDLRPIAVTVNRDHAGLWCWDPVTVNRSAVHHAITDFLILDGVLGCLRQRSGIGIAVGQVNCLGSWLRRANVSRGLLLDMLGEDPAGPSREREVRAERLYGLQMLGIVLILGLPALRLGHSDALLHIMQALDIPAQAVLENGHCGRLVLGSSLTVEGLTGEVDEQVAVRTGELEGHGWLLRREYRGSRGTWNAPRRLRPGRRCGCSLGVQ